MKKEIEREQFDLMEYLRAKIRQSLYKNKNYSKRKYR